MQWAVNRAARARRLKSDQGGLAHKPANKHKEASSC